MLEKGHDEGMNWRQQGRALQDHYSPPNETRNHDQIWLHGIWIRWPHKKYSNDVAAEPWPNGRRTVHESLSLSPPCHMPLITVWKLGMSAAQSSTSLLKSLLQVDEKNVLVCEVWGAVGKQNTVRKKKKTGKYNWAVVKTVIYHQLPLSFQGRAGWLSQLPGKLLAVDPPRPPLQRASPSRRVPVSGWPTSLDWSVGDIKFLSFCSNPGNLEGPSRTSGRIFWGLHWDRIARLLSGGAQLPPEPCKAVRIFFFFHYSFFRNLSIS